MKRLQSIVFFAVFGGVLLYLGCDGGNTAKPPPAKPKYRLDAGAHAGNGTVAITPALAEYDSGAAVTLTPVPDDSCLFMEWQGDAAGTANPLTVIMNSDKSVTAVFLKPDPEVRFTLAVSASGGGAASKSPDSASYPQGAAVTVTAVPDSGYAFTGWAGDASGAENPLNVIMSGNKSVTANFEKQSAYYTLAASATPPGGGTVAKSPDSAAYRAGAEVTLTATPASGYEFTGWSGDVSGAAATVKVTMDGHKEVTAAFRLQEGTPGGDTDPPAPWEPSFPACSGLSAGGLDLTKDNLGLTEHYVIVKYNDGAAPTVTYSEEWAKGAGSDVSGEHVTISVSYYFGNNQVSYNIIVAGTAKNGSLRIEDETGKGYRKTLYLNGVDITNPTGPAINIQSNKRTDVHLVGSCDRRNKLADGPNYGATPIKPGTGLPEQAKGTLFAEGTLVFGGAGSIEIRSKARHAIVSDENFEVNGGNIIVYESVNDGIHANNKITVTGGALQIKCEGDAIQNERSNSPLTVAGGKVTIRTTGTKGHGFVSDSSDIVIRDSVSRPNISITLTGNGSKGLRSHGNVTIDGPDSLYIHAHGARESITEDTSSAAGIKADGDVIIKKGIVHIKSARANENGKGLNVEGNVIISGGTTNITADGDGVKVRGALNFSGGYLKARSANKKDIDGTINRTGTSGTLDYLKN
jgi:uncharacterized repeat protein (TIGR02543 family)